MHIVDNLAYPIILGCDFSRKEKIILRFDNEQHEMQSIDILEDSEDGKSKVYFYHYIVIPAYHQCCVECCITPINGIDKIYLMEPDSTLLTQRGLLIAHSLIDSSTKQLATMIVNISNSTVELKKFQQIAVLEELEIEEQARDDSGQQEIDMIQNGDNIQSRDENINMVHSNIPKLDIDFQHFNDEYLIHHRLNMVQLKVCIKE
jgi:urease gamma subunit